MKKQKKIVIAAVVFMLLAGYILRFWYLNAQFPQGKLYVAPQGEAVEKDGIEYTILSGTVITGSRFADIYGENDDFDSDENVWIVELEAKNLTAEERKIGASDIVGKCGQWANGVEYNSLWYINGEEFDDMLKADGTANVKIAISVNCDLKKLTEKKADWRVELRGWPDRIEMSVPMNGELL